MIMTIKGKREKIEVVSPNYIIWGKTHYTFSDFIRKSDWHMKVNRYSDPEVSEYKIYVNTVEKIIHHVDQHDANIM